MRNDGGRSAPPVALLFTSMDANHDLLVDAAELTAAIPIEFARADRDGDGKISAQEMIAWGTAVLGDPEQLPNRMTFDVDLDGVVTKAEFEKGLQIEFSKLDRNGDGRISRPEMLGEARGFSGPGNDDIGGGRSGGGPGGGGGGGGGRGGGRRGGGGGGNFPG